MFTLSRTIFDIVCQIKTSEDRDLIKQTPVLNENIVHVLLK